MGHLELPYRTLHYF